MFSNDETIDMILIYESVCIIFVLFVINTINSAVYSCYLNHIY
jgi:hypothetical protein